MNRKRVAFVPGSHTGHAEALSHTYTYCTYQNTLLAIYSLSLAALRREKTNNLETFNHLSLQAAAVELTE